MAAPKIIAGASGFAYKPWKGPFYPDDLPDSEMLSYYAGQLPAVEINNTFYRMPKASVMEDWAAKTPAAFTFAVKASRRITHFARLKDAGEHVAYLFDNLAGLGDKADPVLFQLPPNFKKDLDRLKGFLGVLPPKRRVTFELRHPSWFENDVVEALSQAGAALCVAETNADDKRPAITATAGWGYLRLRREGYTKAKLRAWAKAIAKQSWSGAYVFLKHEDKGMAPKLARELMDLTQKGGST